MIQWLTAHDLASYIRLLRDEHSGSFLIVEGGTDARFYKRFVDNEECQIIPANNKSNATEALKILEQGRVAGVLGIVDADFDMLEANSPSNPNLLMTDTHDLETMLVKSPALEKVLSQYGSEDKIKKFGKDIREELLKGGVTIGYLRWVSLQSNLSLKFEDLAFGKFVDENKLVVDTAKMIKTVKDNSQKPALDNKEIQNTLNNLRNEAHDPWQVCCGHDLISIVSLGLRKTLGPGKVKNVNPDIRAEMLESYLQLAYEAVYFCATQLYKAIQKWEEDNKPFKVLSIAMVNLCK